MRTILRYIDHELVRADNEDMQGQYFCERYVYSMLPWLKGNPYLEASLEEFPGATQITFRWPGVYDDEREMLTEKANDKGQGCACGHGEAEYEGAEVVWVKDPTATLEGGDPEFICNDQPWMVTYLLQEEFPSTKELHLYVAPCEKPKE